MLENLYNSAPARKITRKDRIVIFSDTHMGDGGKKDDFVHNGDFFLDLLKHYYSRDFVLILNGDIEELHKFSLPRILSRRQGIYDMFDKFCRRRSMVRIVGNHDYNLYREKEFRLRFPIVEAAKLDFSGNILFIFHGHQAGFIPKFMQPISAFVVRYISYPLGLKNYSVAYNSKKRYRLEEKVYAFAGKKNILAVIGHTHRPLFESLSTIDSIKFRIEKNCRAYPAAAPAQQQELEEKIRKDKQELRKLIDGKETGSGPLYSRDTLVPCVFNSGCCIDRNGLNAIEICDGNIELVYWFDKRRTEKYFNFGDHTPEQLGNSDYWRVTLKKEPLDYVFTRVRLLS
ncbi:MAG: metallophosphoesterase family protein [Candidatus Aminicenantes bacterium]|nr:metallophosphoesterase family protein [Candidatus Aminicenantes bacterium]